jgi:hypothetical protein
LAVGSNPSSETVIQDYVGNVLRELEDLCRRAGLAPSTAANRILGQTDALDTMRRSAQRIDERIARMRKGLRDGPPRVIAKPPQREPVEAVISMTLPLPVSVNKLRTVREAKSAVGSKGIGIITSSPAYRAWQKAAGEELLVQRARWAVKALPFNQRFVCRIRLPMDMPGDIDNRAKAIIDLLVQMRITPDDKMLYQLQVGRSDQVAPDKCLVTVRSLRATGQISRR